MAHRNLKPRTDNFLWETRQDLYTFFKEKFNVESHELDSRIDLARDSFLPRKGRAIRSQELWQKVGLDLARQFGLELGSHSSARSPDSGIESFEVGEIPDTIEEKPREPSSGGGGDEPLFDIELS